MIKNLLALLILAATMAGTTATAQTSPGTLAKIKSAKAINVAYSADSAPFSATGANNEPVGYSIDLCKHVIAQIGRAVGQPDLKVNWLAASVTERLKMVASGHADLECANTTQTVSRLASVDFSNLIFLDGGGLLVKADSPINQIVEVAGKRVAVLKGTTTETRLNNILRLSGINATLVPVADAGAGLAMLETGSVDAYAGDKVKLIALAVQAKAPEALALVAQDLSMEPYAMALPRNDSAFRLEVNKALTQVYMSGEIEQIFAQWLGKLGRPSGLLAAMFLLNSIPD